MKRTLIIVVAVGLVAFGAQRWFSARRAEKAIAERRAELPGYRLEHFEGERLLFLHRPDGSKTGVDLARLQTAYLARMNAADVTKNQNRYSWVMIGPPIAVIIPYFAVEPSLMVRILKKEHPELDTLQSLRRAREFEHDKFNFCTIWAAPGSAEIRAERGYSVCEATR